MVAGSAVVNGWDGELVEVGAVFWKMEDLVIVDEILLAGNHYIVMMNSYPTFMFMKYICS